jgi:hypothetical protein
MNNKGQWNEWNPAELPSWKEHLFIGSHVECYGVQGNWCEKQTCTSQRFSLKTQKKLFLKEQTWMKINPPCLSIHPLWPWPTLDTNSSLKQILFGGVAWLLSQPITPQNCQRKLGKHGKHDATCLRLRGLSIIHPPIQSIHPEWQTKIQTFRGPNSQRLQVSTSDYSDLGH